MSEPHTPASACHIVPCHLADGFDPGHGSGGKPETDRLTCFNRSDSLKAKASLGNIEHNPTVIKRQTDVGELFQRYAAVLTTFLLHHYTFTPELWNAI
jgi:hypothetical protein